MAEVSRRHNLRKLAIKLGVIEPKPQSFALGTEALENKLEEEIEGIKDLSDQEIEEMLAGEEPAEEKPKKPAAKRRRASKKDPEPEVEEEEVEEVEEKPKKPAAKKPATRRRASRKPKVEPEVEPKAEGLVSLDEVIKLLAGLTDLQATTVERLDDIGPKVFQLEGQIATILEYLMYDYNAQLPEDEEECGSVADFSEIFSGE